MKTKPVTFDTLIADYAQPIAEAVATTVDADDRTPAGFIDFLDVAAGRLSSLSQTRNWLLDAADVLRAVQHLGPEDTKTRGRLLTQADGLLCDANEDLQLV